MQLIVWILDLASTIVLLVFAYRKQDIASQATCLNQPNHQLCPETPNARLILRTVGLCIYKIIGACKAAFHVFLIKNL